MLPVIVDTDVSLGTPRAEIDDGAALTVLARANGIDLRAVTTVHGNVSADTATTNARRLLAHLGRSDVPTGRGAVLPLVQDPSWFDEWQAGYGSTPPWPGGEKLPDAASLIIGLIRQSAQPVTLVALGPLTNLALAVRIAPDIVDKVREVVAMGGAWGAEAGTPEFNAHCDPEAAHIVLTAGWPVRLLGLNITDQVIFSRRDFARLPASDPAAALLKEQAPGWITRVEAQGWTHGGCALHDAVTAAALLDASLFEYQRADIHVELADPARRGVVTLQPGGEGRVRAAVNIDAVRCKALIESYLMGETT